MNANLRKKSPRAPSISLQEAIERALKIYEKERRHPAPTDVIAQNIGYKNANNGAALSALASLRYYGLLDRPQEGILAVVKDVEDFKFAPNENLKQELIKKWLKTPPLFADLLDKYEGGLPSDGNIKFDLIQRGFNPSAADSCVSIFRQSVEYAHYYDENSADEGSEQIQESLKPNSVIEIDNKKSMESQSNQNVRINDAEQVAIEDFDRIPVRLTNGRRAWLQIPSPFFAADKVRLKAQIDLILTDDDEEKDDGGDLA